MSPESFRILSKDGLNLSVRHWPVTDPQKVLCVVHGLGEHSGRYQNLGSFLQENSIACLALDVRGHGISEGRKGHSPKYDLLISDVEELLKAARAEYTDAPIILFGHSMGGNLVSGYLRTMNLNELAGYILSAPWFQLAFDPPSWRVNLGKLVNAILPFLQQSNELEATQLSRIPEEVTAYLDDPLVHDKITPGLYFQIQKAGLAALAAVKDIELPGLVYHGSGDEIISHDASKKFASQMTKAEWWSIDGAFHEPHNDLCQPAVFERLRGWILELES